MDLNLTYLKFFYDAALRQSLVESAKINFVSQPAVSQGIRRLEQSLGIELLIHRKNHFALTEQGKVVFSEARKVFESLDEMGRRAGEAEKVPSGLLRIATSHSIAKAIIPNLLKSFRKIHPGIVPQIQMGATNGIKKLISDGSVDLGVTLDEGTLGHFHKTVIEKGRFRLWLPKKTASFSKDFLITEDRPETLALKKTYRKKFKAELPVAMQVGSWEILLELCKAGFGTAFIPEYMVSPIRREYVIENRSGLGSFPYEMVMICKDRNILPRNAKLFMAFVNQKIPRNPSP